ncbi:BglII/BstYI family type II restriction endonuclease [Wohlfahrtiimonas chitiniclastica]|uniref:BglII/BstYI family type II restriction endonuclease n=1 Tax=Wohlfahrtiimonas chitiniclastica TaxID=400946 RepID=UPI001BCCEFF8|nr:BglII/BstYI family type II restriction endonuclease [Wohlfahrtiimonas chitiniclastica]MBS7838029.1 restriction endonuclease [Wohlfahrtiimonas chitiniclastica]
MKIVATFDFNGGQNIVETMYASELAELEQAIQNIDATLYQTKESKEKTMMGKMLYSPVEINKAFRDELYPNGWINHKEPCDYSSFGTYLPGYIAPSRGINNAYRDMDFVKNRLGVEVQFGKYAFMVYNVCAKMTIFKNFGIINAGIEIVPVKNLAEQMSTGVSYFEQFAWDLSKRGVSNIDTPVLILGIDA